MNIAIGEAAEKLAAAIARTVTRPWTIMEVCGGQTHTIVKYGIDRVLPPEVELVHGPGCPVCVTSLEMIDRAHAIASRPDVIFCSFGDMLRVPGSRGDLLQLKSHGSDVRVVYSPLDAVNLAAANPIAPGGVLRHRFRDDGPAQRDGRVDGPQATADEFQRPRLARARAADDYGPPGIAPTIACRRSSVRDMFAPSWAAANTSRSPAVIVCPSSSPASSRSICWKACLRTVQQLEAGRAEVENQYARAVRPEGNPASRRLIEDVFEICDRKWRGVGLIPKSGFKLRDEYRDHDAERLLRGGRHRDAGIVRVHQRTGAQGLEEAARLPRFRQAMHAANAAGRDDGFRRGGLRRVFRLWPASGNGGSKL